MSAGGCKDPFPAFDADDERCDLVASLERSPLLLRGESGRHAVEGEARALHLHRHAGGLRRGAGTRPVHVSVRTRAEMAYAGTHTGDFAQFFLGPDLIVAPVVTPSGNDSLAPSTHWLPEGTWYSDLDHSVIKVTNASGEHRKRQVRRDGGAPVLARGRRRAL